MSAARLILGKRSKTANQECIYKVASSRMNQALKEQATKDTPWPNQGGKKRDHKDTSSDSLAINHWMFTRQVCGENSIAREAYEYIEAAESEVFGVLCNGPSSQPRFGIPPAPAPG